MKLPLDDGPAQLRRVMIEKGACLVGFADVSVLGLPITSIHPRGICFALRHDDQAVDALPDDLKWLEMSTKLGTQSRQVYAAAEAMLDSWGYRHTHITSKTLSDELPGLCEELPQKTVATLAGMGWIGKSALLVSATHGPRVRLGTLLTNMPLPAADVIDCGRCGQCTVCVDACPARAIKGAQWNQRVPRSALLDVARCHAHLSSTKGSLGRKQTCGVCLKVCPTRST